MSKLSYMGRPWAVFDASNRDHRRWFANFQQSGTWGTCPVRFVIADDHGDLVTMIQRRLIEFYVSKEFAKEMAKFAKGREHLIA
jgi:hypothetical protein